MEAQLVLGQAVLELRDKLLALTSIDRMFQLVERFLLSRAGISLEESISMRCVDYAVSQMINNPGIRCLHRLSDEIGYSQKHFINLFKQQVGVSPKQYLRLMRFQKAIRAIETSERIHWSHIALESGYYDQAHFIGDFKRVSSFTPTEYLKRKSSVLNYVPVG